MGRPLCMRSLRILQASGKIVVAGRAGGFGSP
jgi:hypothetical protein